MILTHGSNSILVDGGDSVIGGREYRTVTIGNQTWLAENLDFKFCPIGEAGTPTTPSAWYYNNDEATYGIDGARKCGLLYNWYAVKLLNDNRSELIPGWHVPTNDEWTELANAVGGAPTAAAKLKAANVDWAPSWGGTDDYGFTLFPAGYRFSGSFYDSGNYSSTWTATEYSSANAIYRGCGPVATLDSGYTSKSTASPVRLVKDVT